MDYMSKFINLLWIVFAILCVIILLFIIIINVVVIIKNKKEKPYERSNSEELMYRDNKLQDG